MAECAFRFTLSIRLRGADQSGSCKMIEQMNNLSDPLLLYELQPGTQQHYIINWGFDSLVDVIFTIRFAPKDYVVAISAVSPPAEVVHWIDSKPLVV